MVKKGLDFYKLIWCITPFHLKIKIINDYWRIMIEKYPILKEWTLKWERLYSISGLTNYRTKTIKLSIFLLIGNQKKEFVKNIILHEISHVLTENEKKEHGQIWKKTFLEMGGDGHITYNMEIPYYYYKWRFYCKNGLCKNNIEKINYIYVKKWNKKRCGKCGCYMKKEKINGWQNIIKNGYLL